MPSRLVVAFGVWQVARCVQVLENSFLSQREPASREQAEGKKYFDGIVVLGGGLTDDGRPKEWVVPRLDEALHLYQNAKGPSPSGSPYIICSGASSANLQATVVTEAEACARYLIERDVVAGDVLEEPLARDTDGNAYFSRRLHTDILGLHKLAIVTSDFQMARTEVIFNHVFSLKPLPDKEPYKLSFSATENAGVETASLEARADKEKNSTAFYKENIAKIKSLSDYHRFLFGEHMAYASERLFEDASPDKLSNALKGTYVENSPAIDRVPVVEPVRANPQVSKELYKEELVQPRLTEIESDS